MTTTLLTHALVGEGPQTMVFLHGILGSGANWRTFAKRLVAERPGWRAVLVDLRKHGGSQDFAPPHTLAACANDLIELERDLGHFDVVVGHSFGGKVALEHGRVTSQAPHRPPSVVWVLDTAPGSHPDRKESDSERVVTMLATLPERFPSREAFIAYVEQHGFDRQIAMWLAMNVNADERGSYTMRVDVPAMRALLDDFFVRDEWEWLEDPERTTNVHLVVGDRSPTLDHGERAFANRVALSWPDRTWVHVVDSGHWVHVDAPDALFALLAQYT